MLWLIESAQRMLGMGRRGDVQTGERSWEREGATHGKFYRDYLPDDNKRYSCVHCQAHLAFHDDIISKVRIMLCPDEVFEMFFICLSISMYCKKQQS